jgi:two-component system, NtrC family, response regulator HydG
LLYGNILIVDTEVGVREFLRDALELQGHRVDLAEDSVQAFKRVLRGDIDVAFIEIFLRGDNGLELLRRIKHHVPRTEVVLTGLGLPPSTTMSLLMEGAFAFLAKPLDPDLTVTTLDKALDIQRLRLRNQALDKLLNLQYPVTLPVLCELDKSWLEPFDLGAPTNLPILLHGEAGSQKSCFASYIHKKSPRQDKLFFSLSCQGSPSSTERVLFGNPDDDVTTPSLVELVSDGTLFFADVDGLSHGSQRQLAAILESRTWPMKDGSYLPMNARILASIEGSVQEAIAGQRLILPLVTQLGRLNLGIPPLRARKAAIPQLVRQILQANARQVSEDAMTLLQNYSWPGNMRELLAVLQQVEKSRQAIITPGELPSYLRPDSLSEGDGNDATLTLDEVERRHIARVLARQNGNKVRTARVLDINVKTLYNKIREYKIDA